MDECKKKTIPAARRPGAPYLMVLSSDAGCGAIEQFLDEDNKAAGVADIGVGNM